MSEKVQCYRREQSGSLNQDVLSVTLERYCRGRQTDRWADRQTDRWADRQKGRKADRWADRKGMNGRELRENQTILIQM